MGKNVSERLMSITTQLQESATVQQLLARDHTVTIARAAELIETAYRQGHKVLFCGNGGSAGDAQHLAGELISKLTRERAALPALALTPNSSLITAVANDYAYDQIFVRQVEAFGAPGDILVGISTSGNSANVLRAVAAARARGMQTIAFTGHDGGALAAQVDLAVIVPSHNTQRIQEAHIAIGHIVCDLVEEALFG